MCSSQPMAPVTCPGHHSASQPSFEGVPSHRAVLLHTLASATSQEPVALVACLGRQTVAQVYFSGFLTR